MNNTRTLPTTQSADLVTFNVKIAGESFPPSVQVLSIQIRKEINRIPTAKLVIRDGDPAAETFEVSSQDFFIPGKEIEILAGYHSDEETIFKGVVVKHSIRIRKEGFSTLNIECKNASFRMAVNPKSGYFSDMKDEDVFEEIINQYNLPAEIESTIPTHGILVQKHATDWDFIITRAEANGKIVAVEDGEIKIVAPDVNQDPVLQLSFGATVLDMDAEIDGRFQYESVTSKAWDPAEQSQAESPSEETDWDRNGNISGQEIADSLNLSEYEQRYSAFLSSEELQSWSDARLMKSRLSKTRGRIKIQGHSAVRLNTMIQIDGIGDRLSGKLWVSGVSHSLFEGKWETDIQFGIDPEWFAVKHNINALPAGGLLPAASGLYIGKVTQLESDPDGEDRIQVKIPSINNDEDGIWSRLACLDAGENRGTFFRPEIDDEVVVGFLEDDPRYPVVLGMLNSSAKPTPQAITNDNHEKGYVSRGELTMVFNDEKKSISFTTPAGKKFIMDEDEGSITFEDENGNKVVMNSDGITIESAKDIIMKATGDFKAEGVNVNQKASASFKAEGGAGSELSSGATTTVKGSLVQIN